MGVLDSIFAGENGVASLLHKMLGGSAVIRVKSYYRNEDTGELLSSHVDHPIDFVPADEQKDLTNENAPRASRSDLKIPSDVVSGTFASSDLQVPVVAGRDSLVFGAVEYVIDKISVLKVGDAGVMYSVTAKRA